MDKIFIFDLGAGRPQFVIARDAILPIRQPKFTKL